MCLGRSVLLLRPELLRARPHVSAADPSTVDHHADVKGMHVPAHTVLDAMRCMSCGKDIARLTRCRRSVLLVTSDTYYAVGWHRYTYYLLSTMFGKDERLKRTYLWWGRYLTQFQMFQFVTNMGQVTAFRITSFICAT